MKSLLQIYNLFKHSIEEASNNKDQSKVDTLGPFACVMFPIVFNQAKMQNSGCSTFETAVKNDHQGHVHGDAH